MSEIAIIRYATTSPAVADENQRLVQNVFAELGTEHPDGLRYAVFRLGDNVSFVHVAIVDGESSPLSESRAFKEFAAKASERHAAPPTRDVATLIGSYGFDAL